MNRPALRLCLTVTLTCAVIAAFGAGSAMARTQLNSPFGASAAVNVYAGSCASDPCQMAVWQRVSDGACSIMIIGNGAGLFDDTELYASSGKDTMVLTPTTICGFTLGLLNYNGYYLDLYGRQGDDYLRTDFDGETWFFGEEGNDIILSYSHGTHRGGDGNDSILTQGTFTSESLFGEGGNDTLWDMNGTAATVDCGPGTDTLAQGTAGYPMNINCEIFR